MMHGDHLPAHVIFRDLTRAVGRIARLGPGCNLVRDQALFQFPAEESFASITRPERAIAIERRDGGLELEYQVDELRGAACELTSNGQSYRVRVNQSSRPVARQDKGDINRFEDWVGSAQ